MDNITLYNWLLNSWQDCTCEFSLGLLANINNNYNKSNRIVLHVYQLGGENAIDKPSWCIATTLLGILGPSIFSIDNHIMTRTFFPSSYGLIECITICRTPCTHLIHISNWISCFQGELKPLIKHQLWSTPAQNSKMSFKIRKL